MADQQTVERKAEVISAFGIEIDTPRNNDQLIQSIPGCKLRGAFSNRKPAYSQIRKANVVPKSQIIGAGSFPDIPGQQLHVNPAKLTYSIFDPLTEDPELCQQIGRAMAEGGSALTSDEVKGKPTQHGKLDVHRMKTLCREIRRMIDAREAKIIKGNDFTLAQCDALPGDYLLNPGSTVQNMQPTYEKDWDAYLENLKRVGG